MPGGPESHTGNKVIKAVMMMIEMRKLNPRKAPISPRAICVRSFSSGATLRLHIRQPTIDNKRR